MANFNIKGFRTANGIFQSEFAKVIGLTQSNVSRYENNGIDLTNVMFEKLYSRYGKDKVEPYRILPTQGNENTYQIPVIDSSDPTLADFVEVIKKQSETIRQLIESQNQFTKQITAMNERLLSLLEKISVN